MFDKVLPLFKSFEYVHCYNISLRIIFLSVLFVPIWTHNVLFPSTHRNRTVTIQTAHISLEAVVTLGYTCLTERDEATTSTMRPVRLPADY